MRDPHPQDLVLSVGTTVTLGPSCNTKNSSGLQLRPRHRAGGGLSVGSSCHPPGNMSSFHVLMRKVRPKVTPGPPDFYRIKKSELSHRKKHTLWAANSGRDSSETL